MERGNQSQSKPLESLVLLRCSNQDRMISCVWRHLLSSANSAQWSESPSFCLAFWPGQRSSLAAEGATSWCCAPRAPHASAPNHVYSLAPAARTIIPFVHRAIRRLVNGQVEPTLSRQWRQWPSEMSPWKPAQLVQVLDLLGCPSWYLSGYPSR